MEWGGGKGSGGDGGGGLGVEVVRAKPFTSNGRPMAFDREFAKIGSLREPSRSHWKLPWLSGAILSET